jgi:protein gp37
VVEDCLMGVETKIEWCHHTFNPWWGCQRVSPGCEHCYAEAFAKRTGHKVWGGMVTERRLFGDKHWAEPIKWNTDAAKAGERRRVFCASMADVFEDRRDLDGERARLWRLISDTPSLDWLLLTKRPEHMTRLVPESWTGDWPSNVWAGTTVEEQAAYDKRWPILARVPAIVRFLSIEPQLGPVELRCNGCGDNVDAHLAPDQGGCSGWFPDWVIVGGESGPGARRFDVLWARMLLADCQRTRRIKFFFKQLGAKPGESHPNASEPYNYWDPIDFRDLKDRKGGDWNEWPTGLNLLRVRQFPEVRS